MAEGNGQCRRQYGKVSNQFNECIQNCQHIGQWCARRRHNSQPIGVFVFPVVFSSTTLPDTSDLVSSTFPLSINCSTSFSISSFVFTGTSLFSVSAIIFTCFCSNFRVLFDDEGCSFSSSTVYGKGVGKPCPQLASNVQVFHVIMK